LKSRPSTTTPDQPPVRPTVEIEYLRPPDRTTVFRQQLVHRTDECVVTLMERTPLKAPVRVGDRVILEPDAPAVWFTFPGLWHDIGRFHTAAGEFTGLYANVITPVEFRSPLHWQTTDLFVDVWLDAMALDEGGAPAPELLDEDELEEAALSGWLDPDTVHRARREARHVADRAGAGEWPPRIVLEWTLERVRAP
jgi:uncharacterized protein